MKLNTVGSRLRNIRTRLGINRDDFANEMQISRNSLAAYETDERPPSVDYLMALYKKYGIYPNWVLLGNQKSINVKEEPVANFEIILEEGETMPAFIDMNQLDFTEVLLINKILDMPLKTKESLLHFLLGMESKEH